MSKTKHIKNISRLIAAICMWLFASSTIYGQQFSVASFQVLPNDVSAFINNVRDLNDEACALVKVEAPQDFAFSTPLGIVKRQDEVGEIWLYLPKGTKMLTLKHPAWGVVRDYNLGGVLESRMTYEMKLNLPKADTISQHDTIIQVKTIIDTIAVIKQKPKTPLKIYALATIGITADGPSYGAFFAIMRRHGLFVHTSSNLASTGPTLGHCQRDGATGEAGHKPYYTGSTHYSLYTITAGAIHRITDRFCLFEGAGYGRSAIAWQLSESEGGGYLLNDALTHKGVAAQVGGLFEIGRLTLSASAITIAGKKWQGCVGGGIKLGKRHKRNTSN